MHTQITKMKKLGGLENEIRILGSGWGIMKAGMV